MSNFILYIVTDSNRKHFEIGFSTDIMTTVLKLQKFNSLIFNQRPSLNRIIYTEAFTSLEAAKKKIDELQHFTAMQIERLIRKSNPNWNNLFPQPHRDFAKRGASYAA